MAAPCTSTIKLAILKEFGDLAEDQKSAAMKLAAEILAETLNVDPPTTLDEIFNILARPVERPFTLSGVLPSELRSLIKETVSVFAPTRRKNEENPSLAPLLTEAEKEDRERYLTLPGGLKVPKTATEPYIIFYPHFWVGPEAQGAEVWLRIWRGFISVQSLPDIHQMRHRRAETGMQSWFSLVKTINALNAPLVDMFYGFVDILVEILLLSRAPAGKHSIQTLTFWSNVETKRHSHKPLDYYSDINMARSALESPKNGLFRI